MRIWGLYKHTFWLSKSDVLHWGISGKKDKMVNIKNGPRCGQKLLMFNIYWNLEFVSKGQSVGGQRENSAVDKSLKRVDSISRQKNLCCSIELQPSLLYAFKVWGLLHYDSSVKKHITRHVKSTRMPHSVHCLIWCMGNMDDIRLVKCFMVHEHYTR